MTELIEKADIMSADIPEANAEQEKSALGLDDVLKTGGQERSAQQELPNEEHSQELEQTDNTELHVQQQNTSTSNPEHNGTEDEVKVEATLADPTTSALQDATLAVLPPENTHTEQFPLLSYYPDTSGVNKSAAENLQFPDLGSQAAMIQPLDQAWQPLASAHVELYSSETEQPSMPPTGFAKLEFSDGHFYMTTYAVMLGRDMRAWKIAKRQAAIEAGAPVPPTKPQRSASLNDAPQTPGGKAIKVNGSASIARSFVSESGGIIGDEDGHVDMQTERKRKKKSSKKSKSSDSAPSQIARKHSMDLKVPPPFPDLLESIQPATVDPNVTAKLNPAEHMGDPNYVPLIPIHPPTDLENQGKGISRQHVKIFYSFDHGQFEMQVLGRNGAFHDDRHFAQGSIVPLHDRSDIQIGGVNFTFVLPNAPVDGERTEQSESVSGRMSFTFEDSRGESVMASDVSDEEVYESYDERRTPHYANGFDDEVEEDEDEGDSADQGDELTLEEEEDDEEEVEQVFTKPRRGRPRKHPVQGLPPSKKGLKTDTSRYDKTTTHTKIKITMSKKQKAKFEEKLRAERQARIQAEKETAKKKAARARRESVKEEANVSRVSQKEPSKEASKTPADGSPNGDQSKPIRMARDEAMQNGVDFYDPKLPQGFIVPPRKRGPGRPPKDGVMSKREKALLIRQAKDEEKARKMGLDPSKLPPPEVKSTKTAVRRNSKGEVIEDGMDNTEESKTIRPTKPPRSPSPEMRIEDYTEEQLQRPNANYVILIYEAIKASKTGKMNLQQIYSAIEHRYPYFKFKTTSAGWQSSVRHNLSQHDAFVQVEKDGKGWLWGIKEGVPIERERRKKTPPPQPPPSQPRYPQQPYPFNGYPTGTNRGSASSYPSRFFPPSLSQSTEAKSQSYSSPYATDKLSESGQGQGSTTSTQPRSSYMPPSYSRPPSYAAPQSSTATPVSQNAPQQLQLTKLSGNRGYRPSTDVVETFRKVFVDSYQRKAQGMTTADALAMVNRAIKRVLQPETMEGVQGGPDEMTVALAFENCIAKAVGPPRYVAPVAPGTTGAKARQDSPSAVVNIASSAAITAAASAAPPARSTTPTEPAPAASAQAQTGAPPPHRPAEATLINLLAGAKAGPLPADVANVNGIAKMLAHPRLNGEAAADAAAAAAPPAKPDVEPLTPPAPAGTPLPGAKRAASGAEGGGGKRAKVR